MDVVYHGCIRELVCTGPSSSKSIDGEAFTRGKPTLSCLSCLLFKQRNWCINCSVNILSMFSSVSKGFLRSLPTFLSACPEKKGQFSAKSSHGQAYALSPVLYRIALGSEVVQSHFHFKLSIPSSHRRDPTQNADSHDPIFPFSIRSLLATKSTLLLLVLWCTNVEKEGDIYRALLFVNREFGCSPGHPIPVLLHYVNGPESLAVISCRSSVRE